VELSEKESLMWEEFVTQVSFKPGVSEECVDLYNTLLSNALDALVSREQVRFVAFMNKRHFCTV